MIHKITLKGTATLMISMFYQQERSMNHDTRIIKMAQKWGRHGHLKNSITLTFSRHFEY